VRRIASRDNPLFRELVHLASSARERRRLEASLIEGVHLCEAYLQRHGVPRQVLVADGALGRADVRALLSRLDTAPVALADPLFKALSAVEHGVGVAMLIDTPGPPLPARLDADCVYLDRLQDPGNVGTVLRTCAAAGVARVITAPGTAWCWSPKVLRAGMGAHFALQIHESVGWPELAPRVAVAIRATAANAPRSIWQADLRAPALWLFGQEGGGLSDELSALAGERLSIPQSTAVESLNVGVAASLCLYEQWRQREARGVKGEG
jgi:TrmH family RNA methyltransferase